MATKAVNLRMDEELLNSLKERAEKENRTLSNMIVSILQKEMKIKTGVIQLDSEYISRNDAQKALHAHWDEVWNYDGGGDGIAEICDELLDAVPALTIKK